MNNLDRRTFLKRTGSAFAIVGGLAAASEPAAAYWMGQPVFTTHSAYVRDSASLYGTVIASVEGYTGGRVVDGPVDKHGYRWWEVQFNGWNGNSSVTGWTQESNLQAADFGQPTEGWTTRAHSSDHNGVDISAGGGDTDLGTPIHAARSGTVLHTEKKTTGYGYHVIIDHGYQYTTLYAHLNSIGVSEGNWVGFGEKIGEMGSTGNSTAVHLHFEIREDGIAQTWPVENDDDDWVQHAGVGWDFSGIPSL